MFLMLKVDAVIKVHRAVTLNSLLQDADLIEILWKQDIDIGVPRDHFLFPGDDQESSGVEDDETATLKDKLDIKVSFLSELTQ